MSALIRTMVVLGAVGAVACGATTNTGVQTTPAGQPPDIQTPSGPVQVQASDPGVIPAGQELDVRLQTRLSSETATVEQEFQATTVVDLMQDGRVLVPAGSVVHGVVSGVDPAGRLADRTGRLTLSFDRITVNGESHPLRGMATQVFESGGIREEVGTAGAGAGLGGIVGGLIGGVRGALLGAVIGAGGAIAATEGEDVVLPAGSIVRIRLDSPVDVR